MSFNVAMDGPAGAGKSTVARAVAKELGLIYVDTGAMYRAMALFMLREGVDLKDSGKIAENCTRADITIRYEDGVQVVCLNGENVNGYIRTEEVGEAASVISPVPWCGRTWSGSRKPLPPGATASWTGVTSAPACFRRRS